MYRFFGRFMRSINHAWQLYFVGLVFGIGFDTTTEVLLLAATTYAALAGLPCFAVLALPFLFSGGMMLFDTLDGIFMNFAYGWAFARPVRKVYYNLVITALSIGAAFIVGTIEILGVLTSEVHLRGAFWDVMANFNINLAGFCIAGMFIGRLGGRADLLARRQRGGQMDRRDGKRARACHRPAAAGGGLRAVTGHPLPAAGQPARWPSVVIAPHSSQTRCAMQTGSPPSSPSSVTGATSRISPASDAGPASRASSSRRGLSSVMPPPFAGLASHGAG